MTLKDLFGKKSAKPLSSTSLEDLREGMESYKNVSNKFSLEKRFSPDVDFSDPSNFSFYGSAEKYYEDAIENILEYYPYDGSSAEKNEWKLDASYLDRYVFEKMYPTRVGHVQLGQNYSRGSTNSNGYYDSTSPEYITFFGAPNTGSVNLVGDSLYVNFDKANKVDVSSLRENNLQFSGQKGFTTDFWLKKGSFSSGDESSKQVIFDVWNRETYGTNSYGRLRIELQPGVSGNENKFVLEIMSGSSGTDYVPIGKGLSLTDDSWQQFSIAVKNHNNKLKVELYKNGSLNELIVTGSSINPVTGALFGNLGALTTAVANTYGGLGYGKLSASLDDFRFWKTARSPNNIGLDWRTPIHGGTNTDPYLTSSLGLYYKFNEGIYNPSSVNSFDSTVLDYSGRTSNGRWVGMSTSSRKETSAFVESQTLASEQKDPIIYASHPDVNNLKTNLKATGSLYDQQNGNNMFNSLPSWIVNEDNGHLKNLTQVMSNYFDEAYLQIKSLTDIKSLNYPSSSLQPNSFAQNIMEGYGFVAPDLFIDTNIYDLVNDRSDKVVFEKKINDIKNLIYQNLYNNMVYLFKSKGTEKSVRNLIRGFGINEDHLKVNLYSDSGMYTIGDDYSDKSVIKRYFDFNHPSRFESTVYQMTSSASGGSYSQITSSLWDEELLFITPKETPTGLDTVWELDGAGGIQPLEIPATDSVWQFSSDEISPLTAGIETFSLTNSDQRSYITSSVDHKYEASTLEGEFVFPSRPEKKHNFYFDVPFTQSCLMGVNTAKTTDVGDASWPTDNIDLTIYAVRHSTDTKHAYFKLTSSYLGVDLRSGIFNEVYDSNRWNFAVSVKSKKYPYNNLVSGSVLDSENDYEVTFYGTSFSTDFKENNFNLRADLNSDKAVDYLTSDKRLFVGARRTNHTGSVLDRSDVLGSSVRFWNTYLTNDEVDNHARDGESYGLENLSNGIKVGRTTTKKDALALHWSLANVTSSNSQGRFYVEDSSSGSLGLTSDISFYGPSTKIQHPGLGYSFPVNSSNVVNKEYINSAKNNLPEVLNGEHLVRILSQEDRIFNRDFRPENFYVSVEKSMYSVISDEMVNTFGKLKELNNLIGIPLNKYREGYKDLEKAKQSFFLNVRNEPDLERYFDFYKWIDDSVLEVIKQFLPMSSQMVDGNSNIVESHIFERNKIQHQYPVFEERTPSISSITRGRGELNYPWSRGHAPVSQLQSRNCLWWQQKAEKDHPTISDSIENQREELFASLKETYKKELQKIAVLTADKVSTLNKNLTKKDYTIAETKFGSGVYLLIEASEVAEINNSCEEEENPSEKIILDFGYKKV